VYVALEREIRLIKLFFTLISFKLNHEKFEIFVLTTQEGEQKIIVMGVASGKSLASRWKTSRKLAE